MSGITGKDALGLFEAYQAVYNPQELTEEQIWEEVENWVNSLIDEGYDLSDYTWEEMYEAYVDEERAPGVNPYKPQPKKPLPKEKPLSGEKNPDPTSGYGEDKKFNKPDDRIERPGTEVPPSKKGGYGRIFKNIPHGIGAHATRIISRNTTVTGGDPGAPRSQKIATDARKPRLSREIIRHPKPQAEEYDVYEGKLPLDQARRTRIGRQIGRRTASAEHDYEGSKVEFMPKSGRDKLRKSAAKKVGEVKKMMGALKSAQKNEGYDYYDLILSHLLDEGYANSVDTAKKIMVNMSEQWIESILG